MLREAAKKKSYSSCLAFPQLLLLVGPLVEELFFSASLFSLLSFVDLFRVGRYSRLDETLCADTVLYTILGGKPMDT